MFEVDKRIDFDVFSIKAQLEIINFKQNEFEQIFKEISNWAAASEAQHDPL